MLPGLAGGRWVSDKKGVMPRVGKVSSFLSLKGGENGDTGGHYSIHVTLLYGLYMYFEGV